MQVCLDLKLINQPVLTKLDNKRVQFKTEKLPKTNKDLFLKLKDNEESGARKKHRETAANMLANDRFWAMFTDENLQVDQNDLTFKLLNPVLTKLDNKKVSFGGW